MARRVRNDELAFIGREVAVGNVNSNALLALGLQAVNQQCEIKLFTGSTHLGAVGFQGGHVIFVDHFGVVQQATDQGAFAIIDAAAGKQAQQLFVLVLLEVSLNVFGDEIRLM